jgi:hypothetical protein
VAATEKGILHLVHFCILRFHLPTPTGQQALEAFQAPVTVESAMARDNSMAKLARLPRRPMPPSTLPPKSGQPRRQPRKRLGCKQRILLNRPQPPISCISHVSTMVANAQKQIVFSPHPKLEFKYAEGGSLDRCNDPSTLESTQGLHQLSSALDYLHGRTPPAGHRDIKPQNSLVFRSGVRYGILDKEPGIGITRTNPCGSQTRPKSGRGQRQ